MSLEKITKQGTIIELAPQFEKGTIMHADEINFERYANPRMLNQAFWTGDVALYMIHSGSPAMFLGRNNPILNEIGRFAFNLCDGYIFPTQDMIDQIIRKDSVLFWLDNVYYYSSEDDDAAFDLSTNAYTNTLGNKDKLIGAIYGKGSELEITMKMFRKAGKESLVISVANPESIVRILEKYNAPALLRFCYIGGIDDKYAFGTSDLSTEAKRHIRGVPVRIKGAKDTIEEKIGECEEALKVITENPKVTEDILKKNPMYAARLSTIVKDYLQSKQ